MDKNKVIIYGIGKFAEYVRYVFENDAEIEVCAFCIESGYDVDKKDTYNDLPLVNYDNLENLYSNQDYKLFIAVGDNAVRERLFKETKNKGFEMISYISTKAIYWENLKVGENVIITEDTGIQPFVTIGDNCIIIGAKIGHHTHIGNNVLMSCTFLAGNVTIGNNSFLGLNSSIKQNVTVAENNIIGMSCLITKNTKPNEIYTSPNKAILRKVSSDKLNYLK